MRYVTFILLLTCLFGCSTAASTSSPTQTTSTPAPSVSPTSMLPYSTPSPTSLPTGTPTPSPQVCSPLEGYTLEHLPGLVSNAFNPPPPGSDDPHQGVDLADLLPGSQIAVSGRAVTTILSGQVSGIIGDRFPYGNAVLVETLLSELSAAWLETLQLPAPWAATVPPTTLSCPPQAFEASSTPGERSLYVLYAHLESSPLLQVGEAITCGQPIGTLGMSGNALNPHLHVEVRVGPSRTIFTSMAHYDASATIEEMSSYCTWRVSGQFQPVDPMRLLSSAP